MLALLLKQVKQAGFDMDSLTAQAEGISQTFRHIGGRLDAIETRAEQHADILYRIEQNQIALLSHFGLYVEPSPDVLRLIEARSAEITEAEPVRVAGASRVY